MKLGDRSLEKVDSDYGGDVLSVIDVVRCSAVCQSLADAKVIVDSFKTGGSMCGAGWEFVRSKEGFEDKNGFLTSGYRDVKLNLR